MYTSTLLSIKFTPWMRITQKLSNKLIGTVQELYVLRRVDMCRKPYSAAHLLTVLILSLSSTVVAQNATVPVASNGQSSAPVPTAALHGHVTDPSGALIGGAKIAVMNSAGVAAAAVADSAGSFEVRGLRPGSYIVQSMFPGFAPFSSSAITLTAGQVKLVDIAMAIKAEEENVTVSDDSLGVSVDSGSSVGAIVLKGSDLDALSDDPDELQNELTALAGPSAGPNGGQFYVDGFSGGSLPPKSTIREIRVNQSPFSAEFDRIGFGRIEILTKPGTDTFHGRGFMQGNDKAFNTGNPFTKSIPGYYTIQYNANISGSYKKKISYFINFDGAENQDASVYTVDLPVQDATGHWSAPPTDSNGNPIPTTGSLFSPTTHFGISPRFDFQLGQKNTITTSARYTHSTSSGNIGSTSLPSQSSSSTSSEFSFQGSDSIIVNDHLADEIRVQLRRSSSSSTPVSNAPMINVAQYLSGGGSSGQYSSSHTDHMELQDQFTLSAGAHAVKFGAWLRDNRIAQYSDSGYNGTFTFNTLADYVNTLNGAPSAATLTYTTGDNTKFDVNVFDAAGYIQDDWKFNPFLTLSGGIRVEGQNHTNDHFDFAPRAAIAYALDGHKDHKTKTVLRIGYGLFYDRFGASSLMSIDRDSGAADSQTTTVITNPTCFNATSLSNIAGGLSTCGSGTNLASTTMQLSPTYHSPYTEQLSAGVERQVNKKTTLSATYMHSYGVHQTATRDSNAFLPGSFVYGSSTLTGTRPDPSKGIVNEIYPEAVFKENQLNVMMNTRLRPTFSLMGFYSLAFANGDGGTASNAYNLKQDYGRSNFAHRNMVFLMGNYTGPLKISFNPFLNVQSGGYYDIVTNTDLTGDNFYNDRPAYATDSACSNVANTGRYVSTSFGCLDVTPDPNAKPIPNNLGKGPAAVTLNLRVSRSIGIGPKVTQSSGGMGGFMGGGPMGGPGGGGPPPGGGPGGGFGGRPGGPGAPGGMSNARKYALSFNVQAQNLFNNINYGTPSGTIVPVLVDAATGSYGPGSRFGESMNLSSGMFSSPNGSASRRISFQMSFSF